MVNRRKKDGSPRITVDFQHLNRQCLRETHHTEPPFHLASRIPPNTKKTVLDATDSYHSIELDEESQLLTMFITEWGRYMYLRVPQGFFAAGDIFTSRYDDVIKGVENKVKVIDDALLFSAGIERAFWDTWDFLTICAENGIVINEEKLQFCQDDVEFAGLHISNDGISPSQTTLAAIANFPAPTDLESARRWFGLVNYVSWAYSLSPIMAPFRDMIKPNTSFYWDDALAELFESSKQLILRNISDGVKSFQLGRRTCLQTDWCKQGIGYLLLQKHCACTNKDDVRCCPEGWKLIYAGSRFTKDAESRYKPTEGEALAVAWGLEHSRMFTLGCEDLLVSVDHKPLLGIFNDRDLSTIKNPRIQDFKEATLAWRFDIAHNPGKWHKGADAVSRHPSPILAACISDYEDSSISSTTTSPTATNTTMPDSDPFNTAEERILSVGIANLFAAADSTVSLDDIRNEGRHDDSYSSLITLIEQGFPSSRSLTPPPLREFWDVRDRLITQDDVAYMDQRVVIPSSLRKSILESLHSANQGVTGMRRRANSTIYWPGMSNSINNHRKYCRTCEANAPSQSAEPLILSPAPEWPFQQLCADYFFIDSHGYLVVVDRYSGWPSVFHFPPGHTTTVKLLAELRHLFATYGIPEEISTDGGPQFQHQYEQFLQKWGIHPRLSSVGYAQSNGRAEAGVKTMKRILMDNVSGNGSLDNDKVLKALLQYRNTPLPDINLSPAQVLFHRQLKDSIPTHRNQYHLHKDWVIAPDEREQLYAKRNKVIEMKYNEHARPLPELAVGTIVLIQGKDKKWIKQGKIVEKLENRQYRIKTFGSGRVTLQNRRFIRPCQPITPPTSREVQQPLLQPTASPIHETIVEFTNSNVTPTDTHSNVAVTRNSHQQFQPDCRSEEPLAQSTRGVPRSLRNLATYNNPGLREEPLQPAGRRDKR